MATKNVRPPAAPHLTHEGAQAVRVGAVAQLRRTLMACLLWEDQFYEEGELAADRITRLVAEVDPAEAAQLAIEARTAMKLRHAPLWVARALAAQHWPRVDDLLEAIIQRPDELTEFLALYWKDKRQPVAAAVKRGLAAAFRHFDAYQLAKYNREGAVRLRDVLFVCHAHPKDAEQAATWKQLVDGTLVAPDTWEVALSAGLDKKKTWERLIAEQKLGGLALLRNLRNMQQAGVPEETVKAALANGNFGRVLPFRFIAAARYAPTLERELEAAMFTATADLPKLPGKTVMIVDVSGSMNGALSAQSVLTRLEAAAALAMLVREQCAELHLYATAGNDGIRVHDTRPLPARRGFAMRDLLDGAMRAQGGGGIFLRQCVDAVRLAETDVARLIVFTDEQDCDHKLTPASAVPFGRHNYLVNVAAYQNGIGYGPWCHIDGWSESVLSYIAAAEGVQQ